MATWIVHLAFQHLQQDPDTSGLYSILEFDA